MVQRLVRSEDLALPPGELGWTPRFPQRLGVGTPVIELPGSHEAQFARPAELAAALHCTAQGVTDRTAKGAAGEPMPRVALRGCPRDRVVGRCQGVAGVLSLFRSAVPLGVPKPVQASQPAAAV
jgi:hypothetical protein